MGGGLKQDESCESQFTMTQPFFCLILKLLYNVTNKAWYNSFNFKGLLKESIKHTIGFFDKSFFFIFQLFCPKFLFL